MRHFNRARLRTALFAATAGAVALPYSTQASSATQVVNQINLVTDDAAFLASQGYTPAATVDSHLINPWGMSFGATSPFWISNQGNGTSTLYTGTGAVVPLVVSIPAAMSGPNGPTGQAFVGGSGFALGSGTAVFAFANLNGTISAWNGGTAAQVVAGVLGAPGNPVYTGLATGSVGSNNYLYAANHSGGIDVFDQNFGKITLGTPNFAGTFTDPDQPAGLTPFNIANIGGKLFVTYAQAGPDADEAPLGSGAVDIFNMDGTFVQRFVTGDLSNNLLSPWGITQAPSTFGVFAGDILIGNFAEDDGFINAFAPDGTYLGMLSSGSDPFEIPYLWSLAFRTGGAGVDPNALYITAGIGDEDHGLFAELVPVPEPSTWAMMLVGFGAMGFALRRRTKAGLPQLA